MKKAIVIIYDKKLNKVLTPEQYNSIIKVQNLKDSDIVERFKKIFKISSSGNVEFVD